MKSVSFPQIRIIIFILFSVVFSRIQAGQDLARLSVCDSTRKILAQELIKMYPKQKYVQLYLLPPMGCPRCEGPFSMALNEMERQFPNEPRILLFTDYSYASLAKYFADKNFNADTLIEDIKYHWSDYFRISIPSLQTPHLIRIEVKTGIPVFQESFLGIVLNKDFYSRSQIITPQVTINCKTEWSKLTMMANLASTTSKIPFNEFNEYSFKNYDVLPQPDNYFFYKNKLLFLDRFSPLLYQLNTDGNKITIDLNKIAFKDTFIDKRVPDKIISILKGSGTIQYIYFNPRIHPITGDTWISASLPNVFMDNDSSVGYQNRPVLINVSNPTKCYPLNIDSDSLGLGYRHTQFEFTPAGEVLFPYSKGWPVSGITDSINSGDPANPFEDSFYKNVPVLAKTDLNGNLIQSEGQISEIFSRLHTGYFYQGSVPRVWNKQLIVASIYSGEFFLYTGNLSRRLFALPNRPWVLNSDRSGWMYNSALKDSIRLFSKEEKVYPRNGESQIQYIQDCKRYFKDYILDFQITDYTLFALIKRNEEIFLETYQFANGELIISKPIPQGYQNRLLTGYGFVKDMENTVAPITLNLLYRGNEDLLWITTQLK